jgi:hypothetical protein
LAALKSLGWLCKIIWDQLLSLEQVPRFAIDCFRIGSNSSLRIVPLYFAPWYNCVVIKQCQHSNSQLSDDWGWKPALTFPGSSIGTGSARLWPITDSWNTKCLLSGRILVTPKRRVIPSWACFFRTKMEQDTMRSYVLPEKIAT